MRILAPYQLAFIICVVLLTSNCVYFTQISLRVNHQKIENSISTSQLDGAKLFIGKAPLSKAYEFNFSTTQNNSYSLLFTVHESSFSQSTLKYLLANNLRRDANYIDEAFGVLTALNKNLPRPNEISWHKLNQLSIDEAQEGYKLMLDYIRYKIRTT